jgi:hypothetical protein
LVKNSRGNWVVRDQYGARGGLFVDRAKALRYIRSENGNNPNAVVMVAGVFELDMAGTTETTPHQQFIAPPLRRLMAG